jgi:hypothetical protein
MDRESGVKMQNLWNVSQLASYLSVPRSWVYDRTQCRSSNRIPHFKIGKYLRFDPDSEEFQTWLKRTFQM